MKLNQVKLLKVIEDAIKEYDPKTMNITLDQFISRRVCKVLRQEGASWVTKVGSADLVYGVEDGIYSLDFYPKEIIQLRISSHLHPRGKKYIFTNRTMRYKTGTSVILLRELIAVRNFGNIHAGDLGGYVEFEDNLDHNGKCWVYPDSIICGGARVRGNSVIRGKSIVRGAAIIRDRAVVENCDICDFVVRGDMRLRNFRITRLDIKQ